MQALEQRGFTNLFGVDTSPGMISQGTHPASHDGLRCAGRTADARPSGHEPRHSPPLR
ncbi:hypothetical protein ABZ922_28815 [Streptomyces shenzhenensis]|uniref:hypothetical protein n=1 Tax=Streptomyces shenzhenensis TaxID=943815 RepID=UPI00340AD2CC